MKIPRFPFRHFPHLTRKIIYFVIAMLAVYVCVSESDTDRQTVRGFVLVNHLPSPFNLLLRLTEIHTALCETYGTVLYESHLVVLATK